MGMSVGEGVMVGVGEVVMMGVADGAAVGVIVALGALPEQAARKTTRMIISRFFFISHYPF